MGRQPGERTRYPGVYRVGESEYRIRATATGRRSGRVVQAERLFTGSLQDAAAERARLVVELQEAGAGPAGLPSRPTLLAYAPLWLEAKGAVVSVATGERYRLALEGHVLPALGQVRLEELRPADVQAWVNDEFRAGHAPQTVHGWFRVLRTLCHDATAQLDLPRDPCLRVSFPEMLPAREGANALPPAQLGALLDSVRLEAPQHYAMIATMAFTGLRFCHVSALRWEDIDEAGGVLRIVRSQVRGVVRQVSQRKRAPREYPLHQELAGILRWHRDRLLRDQRSSVRAERRIASGWVFASSTGDGPTKAPSSLTRVWRRACDAAGLQARFTPHGLRRTFNDLTRLAEVDSVVAKSLTGHVTEAMREHYSTVGLEERAQAVDNVVRLVVRG